MKRRWLKSRCAAAVASFVVATVGTTFAAPLLQPARAEEAVDDAGLVFDGFLHRSDLSCGETCHLFGIPRPVGIDAQLRKVVFVSDGALLLVDADSLHQTGTIRISPFSTLTGTIDQVAHRALLGNTPFCAPSPLYCAVADSRPAQIRTASLVDGSTTLYTLPAAYDSYSVISLTTAHPATGAGVVYALLFRDDTPTVGQPHSTLTLVALDESKLDDSKIDSADDAVLWSLPIPACASTPTFSISSNGNQREFLGADPQGRFVYFACRGFVVSGANITQPGAVVVDLPKPFASGPTTDGFTTTFYPYGANVAQAISGGSEEHGLLFIASLGVISKLFVFDANHRAWTGSVPFPANNGGNNLWGVPVDPVTARAYVTQAVDFTFSIQSDQVPTPQGQSLSYGDLKTQNTSTGVVDPVTHRIFIGGQFSHRDGTAYPTDDVAVVYRDTRPPAEVSDGDDPDALTHDIDVTDDVPVTHGSFASGFGARAILVGGAHSTPTGQFLPGGGTPAGLTGSGCDVRKGLEDAAQDDGMSQEDRDQFDQEVPCLTAPSTSDGSRTLTFGEVGRSELTSSASTADAAQFGVDDGSAADQSAVTSYNPADDLWNRYLASSDGSDTEGPPTDAMTEQAKEQGKPITDGAEQQSAPAVCSDYGGAARDQQTPGATTSCRKDDGHTTAAAVGPHLGADSPLQVGYTTAWTTADYSGTNDAVTTASAIARGVTLQIPQGPSISIGEAVATASSTASGRPGTAHSSFARSLSDVVVRDPAGKVLYSCGFSDTDNGPDSSHAACDLRKLTAAANTQTAFPVQFLTPTPDQDPRVAGSPGGAQAEVIKSRYQYWNDFNTNADSGYEIPALEIVLVGDTTQPSRFVLQLAGVHVESHDAIGLPPPPLPPLPDPSLGIGLVDGTGDPLAGGEFALLAADGSTAASCTTGADGVGDCAFAELVPGSYTIRETKAPPGYKSADDFPVTLDPGQAYLAVFVNLEAIGSVTVNLTSAVDQSPIRGGVFAMYAGKSRLGDPLATCTTDKDGSCSFEKVPLGDYTMQQRSAPSGFLPADDYSFSLADPGQEATLNFADGTPAVKSKPARFIPGKPAVPPHTEVVGGMPVITPAAYSTDAGGPTLSSQPVDEAPVVAGLPSRIANLPAQLARLLTHSPQQAVLLLFMWLVLGLPVYLWARRRQLITAIEGV